LRLELGALRTGQSVALLTKDLMGHLADGTVRVAGIPHHEDGLDGPRQQTVLAAVKAAIEPRRRMAEM
jgi:hypothetical protein